MTAVLAICVAVTFGVSVYMMLGRELMGLAMGVFLIGHAANLSILAMSNSPVIQQEVVAHKPDFKAPPILESAAQSNGWIESGIDPLTQIVDPLPQALILTAIVIGFCRDGISSHAHSHDCA